MARGTLIGLAAAGAVTAILGATGVLAVFEDTATTGAAGGQDREEVTTLSRGREVNLLIAPYELDPLAPGSYVCGDFSDDLQTGIFDVTVDANPDGDFGDPRAEGFCLRNAGRSSLDRTQVLLQAFARDQFESSCSGDEGLVDPDGVECGTRGEAVDGLYWGAQETTCGEFRGLSLLSVIRPLAVLDATSEILLNDDPDGPDDLLAGETACFAVTVRYQASTTTDAAAQQSDIVRWRWRIIATQE